MELSEIKKIIEKNVLRQYEVKGLTSALTKLANLVNKYDLSIEEVRELKEKIIGIIEEEQEKQKEKELQEELNNMDFTCNIS